MPASNTYLLVLFIVGCTAQPQRLYEVLEDDDTLGIIDCHAGGEQVSCKKVRRLLPLRQVYHTLPHLQVDFNFEVFLKADTIIMANDSVQLKRKPRPGEEEDKDEHQFSHSYEVTAIIVTARKLCSTGILSIAVF